MPDLFSSLRSSAGALQAYDQALAVIQNNVANASTPGYAKQVQSLEAMPFDPQAGVLGGVRAGQIESARDEYAEQAVRGEAARLGQTQQNVNSLQGLESLFDVTGKTGISRALNNLFQSFSAWGQSAGDVNARTSVLQNAAELADAFRQSAAGLSSLRQDTEQQLQQTTDDINGLAGQLQDLNRQIMAGAKQDAGIDARVHSLLEQLSQYVDFTAMRQADGTVSVLLNGQTPLVIEDRQYNLSYSLAKPVDPPPDYPDGPPQAHIFAADGSDITPRTTGGQLGALLNVRNQVLPSYLGDAYQAGDLNTMAKQFADRVNALLQSGQGDNADPPQMGVPVFLYDTSNNTNVAATLQVDGAVTPGQLGAIDPGPPYVSNGIPLALAALAAPQADADKIDGQSYSAYYGALAARAGSALNDAQDELETRQSTLAQAKDLRQQLSGVSLDEEATMLIQFQRAYEANSRLITVLDQLTQDTINILQP